MNWRIVVAVVVAFVVGAGGGALAEHERVKNDKSHKTTTATTGPAAGANDWFGSEKAAACPALKSWNASATAAFAAASRTKPAWSTTRATLLAQTATNTAAEQALMPFANPAGKAELTFLIAHNGLTTAAIQRATSVAAYLQASRALASARLTASATVLQGAAATCP